MSVVKIKALPATRQELLDSRPLKSRPTIIDIVDPIVVALWEKSEFQSLVDAVVDSAAVEGSLEIDDTLAAQMIRDYAIEHEVKDVRSQNLATLRHALRLVLRRYTQGRKQRSGEPEQVTDEIKKDASE